MTSLRELLEQKQQRTASLPIQVGDLDAAAGEVAIHRATLDVHLQALAGRKDAGDELSDVDHERTQRLRKAVTEALARQAACVVPVELRSLPDDEWDAICEAAPVDEAGDIDLDDVRAALLAASCVDEELRDAGWWERQLAQPSWSKGDKNAVTNLLARLNLYTPTGHAGKG